MPVSPCLEPGCGLFAETRGRCKAHHAERSAEHRRATVGRSVYRSKRWLTVRRAALRRDRYTCTSCRRFGNEVDHVVPLEQGGAPYALSNLQTLCKSCHSRKTAGEVLHRA